MGVIGGASTDRITNKIQCLVSFFSYSSSNSRGIKRGKIPKSLGMLLSPQRDLSQTSILYYYYYYYYYSYKVLSYTSSYCAADADCCVAIDTIPIPPVSSAPMIVNIFLIFV